MFEITLSRGYGENNFREDLKTLYLKLGIENKKTVFLFTDGHVAEEGFLELINNMLTSGDLQQWKHFAEQGKWQNNYIMALLSSVKT